MPSRRDVAWLPVSIGFALCVMSIVFSCVLGKNWLPLLLLSVLAFAPLPVLFQSIGTVDPETGINLCDAWTSCINGLILSGFVCLPLVFWHAVTEFTFAQLSLIYFGYVCFLGGVWTYVKWIRENDDSYDYL